MNSDDDKKLKTESSERDASDKKKFIKPILVTKVISDLIDNDFSLLAGYTGGGY